MYSVNFIFYPVQRKRGSEGVKCGFDDTTICIRLFITCRNLHEIVVCCTRRDKADTWGIVVLCTDPNYLRQSMERMLKIMQCLSSLGIYFGCVKKQV